MASWYSNVDAYIIIDSWIASISNLRIQIRLLIKLKFAISAMFSLRYQDNDSIRINNTLIINIIDG